MHAIGVIPARYSSTRLPGKPLMEIVGKPMLQLVWEAAISATKINRVIIATDDERISEKAEEFGAEVVMTPVDLTSGTDRVAYLIRHIYPLDRPDIVVNIQGDEPLLTGAILDKLLNEFTGTDAPMATIVAPVDATRLFDPSMVKVVCDSEGNAQHFSRSPILLPRGPADHLKHIGIYAFRTHALLDFAQMKPTPGEKSERLEQLRALENGWKIKCVFIPEAVGLIGVDTEESLEKVREKMDQMD